MTAASLAIEMNTLLVEQVVHKRVALKSFRLWLIYHNINYEQKKTFLSKIVGWIGTPIPGKSMLEVNTQL